MNPRKFPHYGKKFSMAWKHPAGLTKRGGHRPARTERLASRGKRFLINDGLSRDVLLMSSFSIILINIYVAAFAGCSMEKSCLINDGFYGRADEPGRRCA